MLLRNSLRFILSFTVVVASVLPAPPAPARYGTLQFQAEANVTRVTFNNPPINLVNVELTSDLYDFLTSLDPKNRTTPPPKVVIFNSNNPDFFLGHLDFNNLVAPFTDDKLAALSQYTACCRLLQNLTSTAFIAEINGEAFGAGQELSIQMDMRFAGPKARTGSIEDALGLVVGAGGQLFLGTLIGRSRALEYLLATKAFDGPTGTALGLFNSHYSSADKLRDAVDELARRIGQLPAQGLNETKFALNQLLNPSLEAETFDVNAFFALDENPVAQTIVTEAIMASQNQTLSPFELGLPDSLVNLTRPSM
ncbi:hypothetical protein MMC10_001735 [Thelotrema lepadinum]|nr:hypothetical protein [Thelotrema lepadinum]